MPAEFLVAKQGASQRVFALKVSAGAADADKIVATGNNGKLDLSLVNAVITPTPNAVAGLDSVGRLPKVLMPSGYEQTAITYVASEALSAGDSVNVFTSNGASRVRKADASTSKEANGFVDQNYATGATVTVLSQGVNSTASGLTPGARVYQSATPGQATTTLPGDTAMWQVIGWATDSTSYDFTYNLPILPPTA